MMAQSKPRRTKTPIAAVRDKFEDVHRASQSEMPMMVPAPAPAPASVPAPAPEVKAKKGNAWISHVKSLAERKGVKFRDALRDPETKASYKK